MPRPAITLFAQSSVSLAATIPLSRPAYMRTASVLPAGVEDPVDVDHELVAGLGGVEGVAEG